MSSILMRNRANNAAARVPQIKHARSVFGMNKSRKQTCKASYLYPIFFEEVMPGDTWEINMTALIRLMPQVAPPIDNLTVSTFFFFDPTRLIWKNFPKQHGEKENPEDTIDYISPKISTPTGGFTARSLQDYLGKPIGVEITTTAFGERMYNHIWNDYFRSEFLQNSVYKNDSDTDDVYSNYSLLKISKMHDYFTDCLPTLQQGDPVQIPLGVSAPVYGIENTPLALRRSAQNVGSDTLSGYNVLQTDGTTSGNHRAAVINSTNAAGLLTSNSAHNVLSKVVSKRINQSSGLYADLSEAVAADISALRLMIQTQEILERDNRNGVRYTEMLEGRYGCINPDLRLHRAQYLGGTKTPLFTTPVVQTSGTGITSQTTPQGNLSGYGVTTDGGGVIKASFGEWGHIMGLMAITATPQYQYGCHRKFTRFERFDYMYPEFMGLSDQAVKNKELYAQNDTIVGSDGEKVNDSVWGYAPRYEEYRTFQNEICGELRSNYATSLDVWHYAESMGNLQNLNGTFIQDKTDTIVQRSMAVQSDEGGDVEDQFLVDIQFNGAVTRVLTAKGLPQTGGRIF